ncbi:MAG: fumarylacetoacetate hydrolase family protein [Micrococcales bacterium]
MRVARFSRDGVLAYGIVDEDELVVLDGHPLLNDYKTTGERLPLSQVKLVAPTLPSKVVCVGLNYAEHAAEADLAVPAEPALFLKPSSSVVGHGDSIVWPPQTERVDMEVELAIVIGAVAKNVTEADAPSVIWGFTIANDVSARDLQASDVQWMRAKGFDTFCPLGPWIETDFVPANQRIYGVINDKEVQASTLGDMIFKPYYLVSYISQQMTLLPGDVILTGTPAGYKKLRKGDSVQCLVEGIGALASTVS